MRDDPSELTPIMGEAELLYARDLSRSRLSPPVAIPGYEQMEFLGRGAFGEVWKAVDRNNGRSVAIKFFRRGGSADWSHMAREVEKLRYLFSDRHVVQLFDVGWNSDPPYFIMEYMEFGSLEDRMRDGPISVHESLRIICEVAEGLVHAHDKGVLHCDLKPANIMLDQDGHPLLADFGQARLRQDQTPSLGTMFYMAPDQADLNAMPDARWDVYALGVIFYRMLTGKLPYSLQGNGHSQWSSGSLENRLNKYREYILKEPLPSAHRKVVGVDKSLAEIVDRCLHTNPKHRYHNVQAVLNDLDKRASRLAKRGLLILGSLGPVTVAVVLAVVAWVMFRNSVSMASSELLSRTKESNSFAAESVASRLALEVDKRWRILEEEANRPELRRWLTELDARGQPFPPESPIHAWMANRHQAWNFQFGDSGKAAYCYVIDRNGSLQTISPLQEPLLGEYFGYRDYFHGQGKELSKTSFPPNPVESPYRSAVFRSQPEDVLAVAFSVPIRSDFSEESHVIGVLVMETILSNISDFRGSRNQSSVLVDLRSDHTGKAGLIVDHPSFNFDPTDLSSPRDTYLEDAMLQRINAIHDAHLNQLFRLTSSEDANRVSSTEPPVSSIIDGYVDPLDSRQNNVFFSAVEPVFVSRGNVLGDTGWSVMIQERQEDTLAPISRIWNIFVSGGVIGLCLVLILLSLMWAFVIFVLNRPGRSMPQKWGTWPHSSLSGTGSSTNTESSVLSKPATPQGPSIESSHS